MAKTVATGIVLSADIKSLKKGISGAKQVLGGFRKALKGAGQGASGMGAAYKSSIDTIFKSVEVFKALQGLITDVFGSFVAASMDMRKENDKQKQDIKALQNSFKGLQAMLGDFILPLILGVADAVKPLIKSFKTWLKVNKDLVSGKLVEYLTTVATTLTSGIAQAVITVMRIWNGWSMLIDSTQAMFQGFFASALQGFAYLREGAAKFYEAIGQEKMAKSLTDGAQAFRDYADSFQDASDQNIAEAARTVKELEELEKQVRKVETAIQTGIGQAGASAMKRFKQDIKKRAANWEELEAKKKELAEKAKKEKEARDKLMDAADAKAMARREAAAQKVADAEKSRIDEQKALVTSLGQSMLGNLETALTQIADGSKKASVAFSDMGKTIITELLKIAAQKALLALVDTLFTGGMGGMLGGGGGIAGAAMSLAGSVAGFSEGGPVYAPNTGRKAFNSGGYVPGFASGGGIDSVRAMLTPGEFVLPKGLVDSIRLGKAPPKASYANGGMVDAGASQGPAAINVSMNTFAVPSKGQFRRWYKSSVAPNTRKMGKRGQL
jgi:hypothetical protein